MAVTMQGGKLGDGGTVGAVRMGGERLGRGSGAVRGHQTSAGARETQADTSFHALQRKECAHSPSHHRPTSAANRTPQITRMILMKETRRLSSASPNNSGLSSSEERGKRREKLLVRGRGEALKGPSRFRPLERERLTHLGSLSRVAKQTATGHSAPCIYFCSGTGGNINTGGLLLPPQPSHYAGVIR